MLVGSKTGPTQKIWLDRIEKRVAATASMLGAMKGIKMSGLTTHLLEMIGNLREEEIESSRAFRILLVKIVSLCKLVNPWEEIDRLTSPTAFASTALTPVVAFGVYILLAKYDQYPLMDNGRVFTSLALMQLLLEPVAFLITALSGLMSAIGCFERIRIYLNSEARDDMVKMGALTKNETLPVGYGGTIDSNSDEHLIEFKGCEKDEICIVASMANCGWHREKDPLLRNLDFEIKRGELTMIVGPVSSGKSTLLKALLRETPLATGFTRLGYRDAAYCAQTPWLTNGTLKENVMGDSHFDPIWYASVVRACALEKDLAQFALGEHTIIGSKGLALSGGQQMRVVGTPKTIELLDANACLGSCKGSLRQEGVDCVRRYIEWT